MKEIGAYEAKTHLSRLLDEVAEGEKITITKHGVAVAVLQPPPERGPMTVQEAIAELRKFRRGKRLGDLSIKDMIEAGRR